MTRHDPAQPITSTEELADAVPLDAEQPRAVRAVTFLIVALVVMLLAPVLLP